jgi:hypothetical protein
MDAAAIQQLILRAGYGEFYCWNGGNTVSKVCDYNDFFWLALTKGCSAENLLLGLYCCSL